MIQLSLAMSDILDHLLRPEKQILENLIFVYKMISYE